MKEIIAFLFGLGLIVNAILFAFQALEIWRKKSSQGVSLITFGGFNILQVLGVWHGILHNDLALTLGMLASFITNFTVIVLIFVYRKKTI